MIFTRFLRSTSAACPVLLRPQIRTLSRPRRMSAVPPPSAEAPIEQPAKPAKTPKAPKAPKDKIPAAAPVPFSTIAHPLTSLSYVDTHCHLDMVITRLPQTHCGAGEFADNEQIAKALQDLRHQSFPSNFEACINVMCDPEYFGGERDAQYIAAEVPPMHNRWESLVEHNPWLYLACGIHPHNAIRYNDTVEEHLLKALAHPRTKAMGEMGLDYFYGLSPKETQKAVFRRQLELAVQLDKPLVIHTREADEDTFEIMDSVLPKAHKIHVHCFTGSAEFAQRLLGRFDNLYIGFTGVITFNSADPIREAVKVVPLEKILLETDAPYMMPLCKDPRFVIRKGPASKIAHCGHIPLIAERIAQVKEVEIDLVMEHARRNTLFVYGL
ncbi:uncharacterized protein BJ171DRAFT_487503 [Polychytrium aggregatum]|uniref:uncharacterized protein n=1 Tax=Polychytrium aggregatum TaxID=110093 RepID=UPI0022FE8C03|nr:uncharacterized protein BJ171DRAFT_487503 [Polychytrium aggregatum]KAI9208855.1 hypothetical protein BJ171DRAFT_487503 [Polychytrium aggregatum]